MEYEDLDDNSTIVNQIEAKYLEEFNDYLWRFLLCFDEILDVFNLSKIILLFDLCNPEPDRPTEYHPTPCSEMIVYRNQSIGKLPEPRCPGFKFAGWFTTKQYSTKIEDYSNVWFSAKRVRLYAKWIYGPVKVNLNPGTGNTVYPEYIYVTYMDKYGILPEPTSSTKRFIYWYDGGSENEITPNTRMTSYLELTLTALYENLYWLLSYDLNGGYGDPPFPLRCTPDVGIPNDSVTLDDGTSFHKPGYKFAGWSESRGSPLIINSDNKLYPWEDTTLYAYWSPIEYTLTYVNTEDRSKTYNHSLTFDKAEELKSIRKLNIFTPTQINNFIYWMFGQHTVPDEEYVVNLTRTENDTVYTFSLTGNKTVSPFNEVYSVYFWTLVERFPALDDTVLVNPDLSPPIADSIKYVNINGDSSEYISVDLYNRSYYKDTQITCYATIDHAYVNKEGFEYKTAWGVTKSGDILLGTASKNNYWITRLFYRKRFLLKYYIKSDKNNYDPTDPISTFSIPFDTGLSTVKSKLVCDPYRDGTYDRKFYQFEDWDPLPERMPAHDISVYTRSTVIPGNLTVTYYQNDTEDVSFANLTPYETQTVKFHWQYDETLGEGYYGKCIVKANSFVVDGKTFNGWYENPNGTGTSHSANSKWKIYTDKKLYAKWS